LQNFEEYKSIGRVTSDPVFDSPEEINRDQIKNLDVLKKGLLHEKVEERKKKRLEELMQQPEYIKFLEQKEKIKNQKAKTKKDMKQLKTIEKVKSQRAKTKKIRLLKEITEKNGNKDDVNLGEKIINEHQIDIKTKECQQKLLEMFKDFNR
jgi:hypothetical protein